MFALSYEAGRGRGYSVGYKLVLITIGLFFSISLHHSMKPSWPPRAYLLTTFAVTIRFRRLCTFFLMKCVNMCALFVFEVHLSFCGITPTLPGHILCRAVTGPGGRGTIAGMGGAFTIYVSRRWCFDITLPFGLLRPVVIFFIFQNTKPVAQIGLRENVVCLDPLGTATFLPAIVATVLPRLYRGRNIQISALYGVVQGGPAIEPGIRNLPLIISNVILAVVCGVLVRIAGYFGPFMLLRAAMASIGAGLLSILHSDLGTGQWIVHQVVLGEGIGIGFQLPLLGGCIFVSVAQGIFRKRNYVVVHTFHPTIGIYAASFFAATVI
ncbi:uncharacterized protein BO88DRAFT_422963 [Aspergillus vadensis CBS 113365]|uniref:Uncharacterized protein n=1 Tax=Aspergillus vadensis (strain CBS 113365 / IMI 142717 / IBT 24658) TaxID=1448311 RepID=A0A319BFZ7_ASPVC|nr:hypothetical protein BO88DRAFT_422963 [Aspergillus vadensis CBS 113365]PYH72096.1 hypothetical protein BO88DRAFT_422963 [Aspergillus vadensis CBS 113365]